MKQKRKMKWKRLTAVILSAIFVFSLFSCSKGDSVKQGEAIGTAGTCVYSKDLGNHLHLVSEVGGRLVDPQSIYDKSAEELSAMAAD